MKHQFDLNIKSKTGEVTLKFDEGKWLAIDKAGKKLGRRKNIKSLVDMLNSDPVVKETKPAKADKPAKAEKETKP